MNLYETSPLVHSRDERIATADLGFAARCYRDVDARSCSAMSDDSATDEAAPRRDGPAQRAARARARPLGRGRPRRRRRHRRRLRPQAARARRRRARSPACAAWSAWARRWPSSRSSSARCPGAPALPGRHRRRRRWAPPRLAGVALRRRTRGIGGEAALAALSLAPSLIALRGGELAAYHGVEHKAIGAYEQGAADARDATKEHDRCGSHLMAPLLAANLAGTALLRRAVERPSPLAGAAVQLASIGAAVEVFAWSERHERHRAGARAAPARPRAAARARARASRPRSSSRSAAPRWPRSCASKRRADSSARGAGEIRCDCRYTRRA